MSYEDFKVEFVSKEDIENITKRFREKFCENNFPLEIESIIERKLNIEIVPIPGLKRVCNSDALITSNWKMIYVDNNYYLDERYENRIRFSFAHEIGHLILHKKIYEGLKIKKFEDFIQYIEYIPREQYGRLETQADIFASHLLIPRELLNKERQKIFKKIPELEKIKVDKSTLDPYLASPLSSIFGVSRQAVEIALKDI
jgi:Zn-dependent peptidase ImmA (M78 family)